jgi:quinol monooxygenase YgiN
MAVDAPMANDAFARLRPCTRPHSQEKPDEHPRSYQLQGTSGTSLRGCGILSYVLPESLQHDGCEVILLRREQDDATQIVSFTQWATRRHYEDYLAWLTAAGLTDEIGQMLTEPMSVEYFDEVIRVSR